MTFLQSRNLFKKLSMIAIALLPLFCLTTAVAPAKASTLFQGDLTVETMTPGDLISVTCISSTNCIAVGFGSGNPANPIFWTGDPSKWTAGNAYVIDLTSLGGGYLNTVTCSSSTNCVGVGGTFAGDIFVWTGDPSKWTAGNAYVIDLTSLGGGQLYSVTCSSSTNCVAVGSTNGIPNEPIVWTGDPSKWTAGNANVINFTSLGGGVLYSVTCSSSTNCVDVGSTTGIPNEPIVWTGDPSKWTAGNANVIDLTSLGGGVLYSVTCSSSTNCVGVGNTFGSLRNPIVWTGDPSKWTAGNANVIDLTSLGGGALNSVTCSSSTNCVGVGVTYGIPNEPIVWTGDPSKWTAGNANKVDLTSLGGGALNSVTCSSSTNCVGVGNTFGSLQYPVIYSFVAPSFGIPWGWGYSPEVINVPTPDAPTNLSVSTPRSGGIITLSWSPVAENGSGPITSYVCSSGAAVTISVTGTSCTFTNKSLIITNNSASLSVVAVNQSGTSDPATLPVQWASPPTTTTTTTTTTPVITTKTITCHKGIHLKKVTGVTPVCPSGWKK